MQYRLEAQHYIADAILERGTVIGDKTAHPLPKDFQPSLHMTPLDSAAEAAMEKRHPHGPRKPFDELDEKNGGDEKGKGRGGEVYNKTDEEMQQLTLQKDKSNAPPMGPGPKKQDDHKK